MGTSEHLEATHYGHFWCPCGACLQAVIEPGRDTLLPSWLECPNAGCEHHGKRWRVPTVTLTRLPEGAG